MNQEKEDKLVQKKIEKLLKLIDKNGYDPKLDKIKNYINKEFNGVGYIYKGDSLFHLAIKYADKTTVLSALYTLEKIGENYNLVNNDGETYLQFLCKKFPFIYVHNYICDYKYSYRVNLTNKDNSGNTILHTILNTYDFKDSIGFELFKDIYDIVMTKSYNSVETDYEQDDSLFELIEKKVSEFEEDTGHIEHIVNNFKYTYYSSNLIEFIKLLYNNPEEFEKMFKNFKYNNQTTELDRILYKIQRINGYYKEKLKATEYLIKNGASPNASNSLGDSYIHKAIKNSREKDNIEYVLDITKIGCENGFNFNSRYLYSDTLSIVGTMLQMSNTLTEISRLYALASKYGYNNLLDEIKRFGISVYKDYHLESYIELEKEIRCKSAKIMIKELLDLYKLKLDDNFLDDCEFINNILDIINYIKLTEEDETDYSFLENVITLISEERKHSMQNNNKIIREDIINKIKVVVSNIISEKLEKKLVKKVN